MAGSGFGTEPYPNGSSSASAFASSLRRPGPRRRRPPSPRCPFSSSAVSWRQSTRRHCCPWLAFAPRPASVLTGWLLGEVVLGEKESPSLPGNALLRRTQSCSVGWWTGSTVSTGRRASACRRSTLGGWRPRSTTSSRPPLRIRRSDGLLPGLQPNVSVMSSGPRTKTFGNAGPEAGGCSPTLEARLRVWRRWGWRGASPRRTCHTGEGDRLVTGILKGGVGVSYGPRVHQGGDFTPFEREGLRAGARALAGARLGCLLGACLSLVVAVGCGGCFLWIVITGPHGERRPASAPMRPPSRSDVSGQPPATFPLGEFFQLGGFHYRIDSLEFAREVDAGLSRELGRGARRHRPAAGHVFLVLRYAQVYVGGPRVVCYREAPLTLHDESGPLRRWGGARGSDERRFARGVVDEHLVVFEVARQDWPSGRGKVVVLERHGAGRAEVAVDFPSPPR
jgi:hypothetical protein